MRSIIFKNHMDLFIRRKTTLLSDASYGILFENIQMIITSNSYKYVELKGAHIQK